MSYTQSIQSFNETREFPWVQAGEPIARGSDLDEALAQANMANWNVRKEEIATSSGLTIPKKMAVVRDTGDGSAVLGVVGNRYVVHQNEEAFAPISDILDTSDLEFATAGYKNQGQQAFVCLRLPDEVKVAGQDRIDMHLIAFTSHDGSLAMTFAVMAGRFACFNALRPTLDTPRKFSIRHTSKSKARVEEVREALGLTFDYVDEFSLQMERWLDQSVTDYQFERIVERMVPIRADLSLGRAATLEGRRETIRRLYHDSSTNEFGRGTKYAAYNALNEYSNWHMPIRGNDGEGVLRAQRTMDDDSIVAKFDARAQALLNA